MNLDPESPPACDDSDAFEHFLTATILTRCLDGSSRQLSHATDIEALIERLSRVLRSAARSATGTRRDCWNALPRHKVWAVAAHVVGNLDRPIRVAELAAVVNISPHHFSRQFRVATGLAPHQYVSHCRMRHAAKLLIDTEMSVCSVALEVGCVDQSHFANTFRRTFGCTPREFQRSARRPGKVDAGDSIGERAGGFALVSCVQRCGPGKRSSAREVPRLRFDRPFTTNQESQ
jgi:AraC-like DNA-binding protein